MTPDGKSDLPTLFVLGDSISLQYGLYLKDMLQGICSYERKADVDKALQNLDVPVGANGGDSSMVLTYLKDKLKAPLFRPDYLILNCGLHDIKTNSETKSRQVEPDLYRQNLQIIYKLCSEYSSTRFIWVRTTPVVSSIHQENTSLFCRYTEDVLLYNSIADEIFGTWDVIDLYSFTFQFGEQAYCDHVHYKEDIRRLQAAFVAGFLYRILS